MDRDDDAEHMDAIEMRLDELASRIETCHQAMLLSRAAIVMGFATFALVFTLAPAYATATVVLAAFTAIIAGIVWLGANKSTGDELEAERVAMEAEKSRLFDRIAARNGWARAVPTLH